MMLSFTDNGGLPLLTFNSLTYYSLNPVLFYLMINKKLLFFFLFYSLSASHLYNNF